MPTVATYYQLQYDIVNLSVGSLKLTQNITDTPAGGEGALVTWFAGATPTAFGSAVTYTVTLNGTPIGNYEALANFTTVPSRIPVQEATATNLVHKGRNELIFTITGGTATLTLSAVMLWHRVNV